MANPMLTLQGVSAHYGPIQALHNINLHISQGEIVTLIGANGAGKTTLRGTLCGEPRASSGTIVFDGKTITDWQTAKIMREAIAIVPEGRRVFSRMTVEENLAMGGFFASRHVLSGFTSCFPGWQNAKCSVPVPCPAVNSRCWRLVVR